MSPGTKNKLIISVVLLLCTSGLFAFVGYSVKERGEDLSAQIEMITDEQAKEATRLQVLGLANETEEERMKLSQAFLREEGDSIPLVNAIEAMAVQYGIELDTEQLAIKEVDGETWLEVGFALGGGRERLHRFLLLLESLPYHTRLTNLVVESRTQSYHEANVTIRVRILAYDS